ncbi:MAG: response regulator transcription factor [Chloroflexi bacterium]|nr:response regulator transcription factor [Chloroflexota bacterium]
MKKTRILIADDHPVFRDGIRKLFTEHGNLEVIGQADDGEEAVKLADELEPDLVIMDIMMPKLNGIEATKQIKASHPATAILLLSGYSYDSYVIAALKAGAAGFLTKGARSTELLDAINAIQLGEPVLDPTLAYKLISQLVSTDDTEVRPHLEDLREREIDVLRLAAKGMTNKSIADELFLSSRTVQTHFANIFRKLNVSSRTEAVLRALKEGWISPDDLP